MGGNLAPPQGVRNVSGHRETGTGGCRSSGQPPLVSLDGVLEPPKTVRLKEESSLFLFCLSVQMDGAPSHEVNGDTLHSEMTVSWLPEGKWRRAMGEGGQIHGDRAGMDSGWCACNAIQR